MIPRKLKPCKECGEDSYLWSKGRCKRCVSKSYGGIKPTVNNERAKLQKQQFNTDREFYLEVWNERPHVCINCNCNLGEINLLYFHHIIRKSTYPQFRYDKDNIAILCGQCHNQVETDISKAPKIKELTIKLFKQKLNL